MLFSSLALPALFLAVAEAKHHYSRHAHKACTDPSKALLVIKNGLESYRDITHRAKGVTFAVTQAESEDKTNTKKFKKIYKKEGAVALSLTKEETIALNKEAKKSSSFKKACKRIEHNFKSNVHHSLKYVILHKKANKSLVKAFHKRGIKVIAARRKLDRKSSVSKLVKKIDEDENKEAGVIFYDAQKYKKKSFKKLVKALKDNLVRPSKCFKKKSKHESDAEDGEKSAAETKTIETTDAEA